MDVRNESLLAGDGIALDIREFGPSGSAAARSLVIVHGLGEHGGRYVRIAEAFAARSWRVIIGDLRGHGRSGGVRTHVARFDEYLEDLHLLFRHFRLDPARTALLGHSTGGLISIRFLQSYPDRAAALALTSPLLEPAVPVGSVKRLAGALLTRIAPRTRFRTNVDPAALTRDLDVAREWRNDALLVHTVTARWYFEMLKAVRLAHVEAERIAVPLLLLQAGDDTIVNPRAAAGWLSSTASADRELRILPGHLHELPHEIDWRETVALVADWLERRVRE